MWMEQSVAVEPSEYNGTRFSRVWEQVVEDPYLSLPQYKVSARKFFDGFTNLLLENSKRTIDDKNDLLPYFDKLLHPNGICLKGTWNITQDSPYTGYFSKNSRALIIARASTALSNTQTGTNRAFGFAGKIYPTVDENHQSLLKTANFFTIEDLGGNRRDYFLDAKNTNDIIKISPSLTAFMQSLVGVHAAFAFPASESSTIKTALIRELYPIAELGLMDNQASVAPIWMRILGADDMPRIDTDDFRHELDIVHYPDGLRFTIEVASVGSRFGNKNWLNIGYIELSESIVSSSCDHRLHFSHPKARHIY